jgi:hypothetical protein
MKQTAQLPLKTPRVAEIRRICFRMGCTVRVQTELEIIFRSQNWIQRCKRIPRGQSPQHTALWQWRMLNNDNMLLTEYYPFLLLNKMIIKVFCIPEYTEFSCVSRDFLLLINIVTYPVFAWLIRRVLDLMIEFIGPLYRWLQQFTNH